MDTTKNLVAELQSRSKGTPYTIEKVGEYRFLLKLDIVDTSYYLPMYKNGVKRAFSIEVRIDPAKRSVQTTDSLYALDWQVGTNPVDVKPSVKWDRAVMRGEIYTIERRIDLGVTKDGKVRAAVNYGFNTRAAKKWLDRQLTDLGWKRTWGKQAKIGLVFGIIAAVGALATIAALLGLLVFSPDSFSQPRN